MTDKLVSVDAGSLLAAFNRLSALGENPTPGLEAVGRVLETRVRLGFHTSTDPYGRPWLPLKTRSGQPLRDKGHLMNSISSQVEGDTVIIGTPFEYARVHQFGAVIQATNARALRFFVDGRPVFVGRGAQVKIPPRPIFPMEGLPLDWQADALDAVGNVFADAWRA